MRRLEAMATQQATELVELFRHGVLVDFRGKSARNMVENPWENRRKSRLDLTKKPCGAEIGASEKKTVAGFEHLTFRTAEIGD